MFSSTIKRSAATFGVVLAGLLAAAGPASASAGTNLQPWDALVKTPIDDMNLSIRGDADNGHADFCGVDVSADHIEGYVVTNNNDPDAMAIARGTQVGSEGVKAPTEAGPQPEVNCTSGGDRHTEQVSFIRGAAQDTQASRTSSLQDCMVSGYNVVGTQVGSEGVSPTKPSDTNAGRNTSVVDVIERDDGVKADNKSKYELEECMVSGFSWGQGAIG